MMKRAKLSRKKNVRQALLKALARALVSREKITTTQAKAREVARVAEGLVTKAKGGDEKAIAALLSKRLAKKLSKDIAPRFQHRQGGYTRITKLGVQKSTGAAMALVEFVL